MEEKDTTSIVYIFCQLPLSNRTRKKKKFDLSVSRLLRLQRLPAKSRRPNCTYWSVSSRKEEAPLERKRRTKRRRIMCKKKQKGKMSVTYFFFNFSESQTLFFCPQSRWLARQP